MATCITITPMTMGAVKYTTRAMRRPRGDSGTLNECMRCLSDMLGAAAVPDGEDEGADKADRGDEDDDE